MNNQPLLLPWMLNSRTFPNNSLRVYLYIYALLGKSKNPKLQLPFSRQEFAERLGFSYNSIQAALADLCELNIITIDPEKNGNKNLLRLNEVKEFNKAVILKRFQQRIVETLNNDEAPCADESENS